MQPPTVRFRIQFSRDFAVGPGKIDLLEQIDRSGSLSQAARELKMSYRRAWLLVDSLNGGFGERLVITSTGGRHGGGASLTPLGRSLIGAYRRFEATMQTRAARHFDSFAHRNHQSPERPRTAPKRRLAAR